MIFVYESLKVYSVKILQKLIFRLISKRVKYVGKANQLFNVTISLKMLLQFH